MLPNGFPDGLTIRGLSVGSATLTVDIEPATTTLTLTSGGPITLDTPSGPQTVTSGAPVYLPTRPAC